MEFIYKHLRYLRYVVVHKTYVLQECIKMGWKHGNMLTMIYRGVMHDLSKFTPTEWLAYVEYFEGGWNKDYGCPSVTLSNFNLAWIKHIHRNPHHWQHYVLYEDDGKCVTLDMPKTVIMEMVADWHGAGRMWGKNDTLNWYRKNRSKQRMSDYTRKQVELLLKDVR